MSMVCEYGVYEGVIKKAKMVAKGENAGESGERCWRKYAFQHISFLILLYGLLYIPHIYIILLASVFVLLFTY